MDDAFLVRQVVAGNRAAFRLLVLRYERPLFRFLGFLGLDAGAAEDIAQEAFLRAFRALASFDPKRAKFSSWLFTIAKRLAVNEHRRAAHRVETPLLEAHEVSHSAPDQSEGLLRAEQRDRLERALAELPEPLRSTF
ncbi:MAG TPA: sigma-70 family RNA polymerase sigma factor, partial [Polyangiaceae bacterium]